MKLETRASRPGGFSAAVQDRSRKRRTTQGTLSTKPLFTAIARCYSETVLPFRPSILPCVPLTYETAPAQFRALLGDASSPPSLPSHRPQCFGGPGNGETDGPQQGPDGPQQALTGPRRPAACRNQVRSAPRASGGRLTRFPENAFFTPTGPPSELRTPKTGRRGLTEAFRSPKPSPISPGNMQEVPRAIPRDRQNGHFFTQIHPPSHRPRAANQPRRVKARIKTGERASARSPDTPGTRGRGTVKSPNFPTFLS